MIGELSLSAEEEAEEEEEEQEGERYDHRREQNNEKVSGNGNNHVDTEDDDEEEEEGLEDDEENEEADWSDNKSPNPHTQRRIRQSVSNRLQLSLGFDSLPTASSSGLTSPVPQLFINQPVTLSPGDFIPILTL